MKSFYVINEDSNSKKFESYDIMPYLLDKYYTASKSDRPKTFNECKKFIEKNSMYQWWARTEYEIIITDWPFKKYEEKWDIHKQVMMNIDVITYVFIDNINSKD